ncbi:VPLPA-CTERM sorting domain-containing protein [Paracoccus sp. 22332]|uniref:VPLPA-CTERM sorting domain-containing protein n=1 Tax=Paracoccus sp. 22332 TaxID=3453913 RepID=UPI003F8623BD
MGIRALCAAAAVVVGVGSAAEAATTVSYDLWLRYEGTAFTSAFHETTGDPDTTVTGDFAADDMLPGMKSYLFGAIPVGEVIHFVATMVHPDQPVEDDPYYGNGGRTPVCQFGVWDCTKTNYIDPTKFLFSWDDKWQVAGGVETGSTLMVELWSTSLPFPMYSDDGRYSYGYDYEYSYFTVVADPAPVPLPATAALLPLGIGALALMRRRRRVS